MRDEWPDGDQGTAGWRSIEDDGSPARIASAGNRVITALRHPVYPHLKPGERSAVRRGAADLDLVRERFVRAIAGIGVCRRPCSVVPTPVLIRHTTMGCVYYSLVDHKLYPLESLFDVGRRVLANLKEGLDHGIEAVKRLHAGVIAATARGGAEAQSKRGRLRRVVRCPD